MTYSFLDGFSRRTVADFPLGPHPQTACPSGFSASLNRFGVSPAPQMGTMPVHECRRAEKTCELPDNWQRPSTPRKSAGARRLATQYLKGQIFYAFRAEGCRLKRTSDPSLSSAPARNARSQL